MTWYTFLAISIVTSISWTLLQRVLMKDKDNDPIAFSIAAGIVAGAMVLIYALIRGFSVANIEKFIPNLILMAILYGTSNVFMFRSFQLIEASSFTVFFTTRALWSIVAAIIFLGETFSSKQFVGTLFIISGVILVSLKANKLKLQKGEVYALISAAVFGLQFANDAFMLRGLDAFFYVILIFIVPSLLVWAIYPKSTKKVIRLFTSPVLPKLILLSGLFAVSAVSFMLAYQIGRNAAQIAAINQTQTILGVIAATIILKERSNYLKKVLASILAFIGVLLVR